MHKNGRLDDHQKFKELGALAQGGECSDSDWLELKRHLQACGSCREAYSEYSLIAKEGMPFLAAACGYTPECKNWDEGAAWSELLSRIQEAEQPGPTLVKASWPRPGHGFLPRSLGPQWAAVAVVALLIVAVSAGAYRLGSLTRATGGQGATVSSAHLQEFDSEKKTANDLLLASQTTQMSGLQKQISNEQQELSRLRAALRAAEDQSRELSTGIGDRDERFRRLSDQRYKLASQLLDPEQYAQIPQPER